MSKLQILFLAWSISVIVLSILIILFRYVYLKEHNRKTSSTESVKGSVVGYRYYTDAIAPIVEYIVNDKAYRRSLEYEWVTTVSLPWKSSKATSNPDWKSSKATSNPDLLAKRLVIYTNSSVPYAAKDFFPLGSTLTVWYNPDNPKESYVERFCGAVKVYKFTYWTLLLTLVFITIICLTIAI